MSSLTNVNVQSKTMNGLNTINADEITTDNFTATNLNATDLTITGAVNLPVNSILDSYLSNNVPLKNQANTFTNINTFTQPPVMSGASIQNATIPVSAINGLSTGYMDLTTNQIVTSGVKTFNVAPVVPRLGMVSANSTFVGNNMNTNASEGTYVGFQAGRLQTNLASRNTAIGCNALDRLPQSNQNTAVGYQALYLFSDGGSLANTALGAYSLATLRSGSRNIGVGTAAGNGLVNQCSNNVAFASDSISNSSNLTLFTYKNISGANVPYANPFIIDPVRFNTTGGTIRARMYMRFYNGTGAGAVRIESYDSATYAITFVSAAGTGSVGCAKDASLRFTQGGTDASIDTNYTGAGGTGTTFTIATGLGTIPAGFIMVYSTTATKTQWATVSSYDSTTGVLVLTTSITLVAGLINFFASNIDRGSYVSNCCAIGAGALQNFACGQSAPMIGNCAFGQNALNGAGGGYDNASFLAGNYNTSFGNNAGSWCTSTCSFNTFLGADTNILVPYSTINVSTAIGYGAKLDDSNLIVLGTVFETTRCWAMDVRGLPNFSAGLTVSAGAITLPANSISDNALSSNVPLKNVVNTFTAVQNFEANIRGVAPSGDLFQAFKNTGVGNAGHILINGEGNLLYYDTTASAIKWRLDTSGNLVVGSIDLSGTLISKTTTGDFIRSNSNASQYFYASNNGSIGYIDSGAGNGYGWYINTNGTARFRSTTNSFKYWAFDGNLFRYYNLGGVFSITLNGDTGAITTPGAITTTNTITTANLNVSGTINGVGVNTNFGGDITTTYGVYAETLDANYGIASRYFLDLTDPLASILFSGSNAGIRIGEGVVFLTDTTANNINIGNSSVALGGENVVIGYNAKGGTTGLGGALKGQGTVQVGAYCESEGEYSVGVGHNTTSYAQAIAIGRNAVAQAQGVAIGYGSNSGQATNIAIGFDATTPFTSSHAIGTGIATTAQGQFALGSTNNSFLFSQTFYPWEVSPTTITGTSTIAGAPFYGWYLIATTSAGTYTITIPVITAQMVGLVLNFRKINANAFGSTCSITCSAGNTYMPLNSITATTGATAFIGGTATTGRICIINTTQFAVLN